MLHVVTALIENDDGTIVKYQREFGGFKRDMNRTLTLGDRKT
jgi:hypothetical protein